MDVDEDDEDDKLHFGRGSVIYLIILYTWNITAVHKAIPSTQSNARMP